MRNKPRDEKKMGERKQEVLIWVSCRCHSVSIVFISSAYFLCCFCRYLSGRAAMKPGRGTADRLVGGGVAEDFKNPAGSHLGSEVNPSLLVSLMMKRCIRANRGEENPVWKSHRFLFLPLPKLWNLGAQPCQPGGGGNAATRHLQPSGRGRGEVEGWTNSHSRAA